VCDQIKLCLGLGLRRVFRSNSGSENVTVLGRVRSVDQQPSGEPEVGDEGRHQQQPGDDSVVSRPEEVQAGVDSVADSSKAHGVSHVARENSPQDNGESEKEHVNTSEDLLHVVSVLVHQQKHVRDLGSDRRHVVGVEVLLDDVIDGAARVQQEAGGDQEDDVGSTDGLLNNLEGADGHGGSGVNTGTDQDETQGHTDDNIDDADNKVKEDSNLEHWKGFSDFVHGLLRLLPFDKNPSHGNGGVDGTKDGDDSEDTSGEGGSSEATSSLLKLLALLLKDGLGIRHLDELVSWFVRHGDRCICLVMSML